MTYDSDPSCPKSAYDCYKNTTYSAFTSFTNTNVPDTKIDGDWVEGDYALSSNFTSNAFIGTWLQRDSVDAVPLECLSNPSSPCSSNVPVPASFALVGLGLISLSSMRLRQAID